MMLRRLLFSYSGFHCWLLQPFTFSSNSYIINNIGWRTGGLVIDSRRSTVSLYLLTENVMYKFFLAFVLFFASFNIAQAQYYTSPPRGHKYHYHHHHNHSRSAPWIAGGIALGILGVGAYLGSRNCWYEKREVWNRFDRFIGYENVRVCR